MAEPVFFAKPEFFLTLDKYAISPRPIIPFLNLKPVFKLSLGGGGLGVLVGFGASRWSVGGPGLG